MVNSGDDTQDPPKFTVDTHIFRELGEMLVGRDSTALVELIKNAYDADATRVSVFGEGLDTPSSGRIIVTDDGNGMTPQVFRDGFLRIASRLKEEGERRSAKFGRRYTGAKGIGRLAAHKLAKQMEVRSVPDPEFVEGDPKTVEARIDWNKIESLPTLDAIPDSDALVVNESSGRLSTRHGTTLELRNLRKRWTASERTRFFWEVRTFSPSPILVSIPEKYVPSGLLFDEPHIADANAKDPRLDVKLLGEFEAGDEYWSTLLDTAHWVIEIRSNERKREVEYLVSPTRRFLRDEPNARPAHHRIDYPAQTDGPFFDARILIREGPLAGVTSDSKAWVSRMTGIHVYMEGFRVLPYGDRSDDWLDLESDYNRRVRALGYLSEYDGLGEEVAVEDEGLSFLPSSNYFGAIFLTQERAKQLQMVVNREGFIPNAGFDALKQTVRIGIDLSVRVRAAAGTERRKKWREQRSPTSHQAPAHPMQLREAVNSAISRAAVLAKEARRDAAEGRIEKAAAKVEEAAAQFHEGSRLSERMVSEPSVMRMLAAIGTQMAAFVHEINGLLGTAQSLESIVERIRRDKSLSADARQKLAELGRSLGDLRRTVERQASYLTDITSPDARRRRSRQKLAERFDAATRLIAPRAEQRNIEICNDMVTSFKSPPMFPAEVTLIFSNLLSNAVKAAGKDGKIIATVEQDGDNMRIRIENTGVAVKLRDAERWFRPFESTTERPDPYLGQGMGMGLPITRNMIEEYGGTIRFTDPSPGYATALEITLPNIG
jgi:signal transduction histidine kinase